MEVRLPTPAGREERQKQGSSRKYLQTLRLSSCSASASHPVSFLGRREIRGGKDGKQRITSIPDFLFHPKKNEKPLKNFNLGSEVVKLTVWVFSVIGFVKQHSNARFLPY